MTGTRHDTAHPERCWCRPFCMADGLWIHADERVPLGMALPLDRLDPPEAPVSSSPNLGTVFARNTCAHCRRPIAYLAGVGWLHDELLAYADDPIGCSAAQPADWLCSFCAQPRPTSFASDGQRRVDAHDRYGRLCLGSRKPAVAPPEVST